jgi:hypothetical protein
MRYLSAAVAIAVVASLVSCDTGESGDPTEGTTSQAVSTKDARFADDAKDLRESISELLQDARRVRRGQPPTHKPAFLGYDFDCSDRVDPEGSAIRGEPRPLIDARFLFREACRRFRIAEREAVLGRVERARTLKAVAEARLAQRYALAARDALDRL